MIVMINRDLCCKAWKHDSSYPGIAGMRVKIIVNHDNHDNLRSYYLKNSYFRAPLKRFMFFNSIQFAIFLPIVFAIYWSIQGKNIRQQNLLLLFASYYFYACWDWRFLFLLIFSTFLDFYTGARIERANSASSKKFWLWLSICVNLGFLGFFKYYNFFISNFVDLFAGVGLHINSWTLKIILPVGISFYTFHGLSYVIDIYKGRISSEKNFIDYSLFVGFFPLLVAGPIERATHLLPQVKTKRTFDYNEGVEGLKQILWGLFKKIVIADTCTELVNETFNNPTQYGGAMLVLGAVFFAFQIYCDFSGYSDIALGTARLFGFRLLRNFAYPYFSRDIAEFWRRWHISLSSWFKDYLYIPLGGSKGGTWKKIRNTFIIFLVSGFWHGANWTFIAWGGLNALFIMPSIIFNTNRNNLDIVAKNKLLPSFRELLLMLTTFAMTCFAWIFFRSNSMHQAFSYIKNIFTGSFLKMPSAHLLKVGISCIASIFFLIIFEWRARDREFALEGLPLGQRRTINWAFYSCLLIFIYKTATVVSDQQFIYFQF
jgi:D-alanyl-lipoteichoic acid acyltransferase DltB (MBOAT superfamily)